MALTKFTADVENIQALSDKPNEIEGLTADQLKKKFDDAAIDQKTYNNDILTAELDTALSLKSPLANPTFTGTVVLPSTTSIGDVSNTELSYVNGVTSAIQTQIDDKTPNNGWTLANETWTYVSVDDPTGVIKVQADVTTKYSLGMRIKMTNSGNTIFGILTKIGTFGGDAAGYTYLTFLHEIDPIDSLALYLMANSAITNNYYSNVKAPFGFPLTSNKWTVYTSYTSDASQASPGAGTWYNLGSVYKDIPIGFWDLGYKVSAQNGYAQASSQNRVITVALSTTNNSTTNPEFNMQTGIIGNYIRNVFEHFEPKLITGKQRWYLNTMSDTATGDTIYNLGAGKPTQIVAISLYL